MDNFPKNTIQNVENPNSQSYLQTAKYSEPPKTSPKYGKDYLIIKFYRKDTNLKEQDHVLGIQSMFIMGAKVNNTVLYTWNLV